jgi:hypothetical protein
LGDDIDCGDDESYGHIDVDDSTAKGSEYVTLKDKRLTAQYVIFHYGQGPYGF